MQRLGIGKPERVVELPQFAPRKKPGFVPTDI
jgi:hypothetical protein